MVHGRKGLSQHPLVIRCLCFGILFLAGIGSGTVAWLELQITNPYWGKPHKNRLISIEYGSSVRQIGTLLDKVDIIQSNFAFTLYVQLSGFDHLQAGEYLFENPLKLTEVVTKLKNGQVHHHRITIPEGLMMEDIIDRFVQEGFGKRSKLETLTGRTDLLGILDPQAINLEGYLFPDTYFFARSDQELTLVSTLVSRFKQIWNQDREERARALDLTTREVITLASLIEKETALPSERPLVSAVFHNRLRKKIKLACDPTVIFAIRKIKEYDGIIHRSDLTLDSPYNTYLYLGLPPGPIASPGIASIDAALNPAPVNHLYFVSKNDGSHVFSDHYQDHQQAVWRYQR